MKDDGLVDLLMELEEYFDQRADAEYFSDRPGPVGNEEMHFLVEVKEMLNKYQKPV